ncbi:MAG: fasciclin domain-containing protein [Marinilabiliaceae bacterium]|nr:fasciclin domain-containing protein [Marinilabiliaceae bacterium]
MIKYKFKGLLLFIVTVSSLFVVSCNDEWDNHYKSNLTGSANIRIGEFINQRPELSFFNSMIKIAGYDKVLNQSQTYTVWVPADGDWKNSIDTTDVDLVKNIVKNHITRFAIPTTEITQSRIKMLSQKKVFFEQVAGGFTFGDNNLIEPSYSTLNGVVHIVSEYVPYQFNIYELLGYTDGLDSLSNYLYSNALEVFDPISSTQITEDSLGNKIYDSLFIESNIVLEKIGNIDSEDTLFTTLLLSNNAWNEGYDTVSTFFVSNHKTKAASIQREYTMIEIVRNTVFKGFYEFPFTYDSLISTTGTVFSSDEVSQLFSSTTQVYASNGIGFITDHFNFNPQKGWYKEIRLEAEETEGRKVNLAEIYLKSGIGFDLDISGEDKEFISVVSTATKTLQKVLQGVEFTIPTNLSAKYNIYCVFVPSWVVTGIVEGQTAEANFQISYTGADGSRVDKQNLTVTNNVIDTLGLTKMLVAEKFEFPFCHLKEDLPEESVVLKVKNPTVKETTTRSKTFYIDCIILEPVE